MILKKQWHQAELSYKPKCKVRKTIIFTTIVKMY